MIMTTMTKPAMTMKTITMTKTTSPQTTTWYLCVGACASKFVSIRSLEGKDLPVIVNLPLVEHLPSDNEDYFLETVFLSHEPKII